MGKVCHVQGLHIGEGCFEGIGDAIQPAAVWVRVQILFFLILNFGKMPPKTNQTKFLGFSELRRNFGTKSEGSK
jgi:hypothetical protein